MENILWDESLSVGNQRIDNQHKQLIQILNRLINSLYTDFDRVLFSEILSELLEYSRVHFRDEELLLEEKKYPKLADHHNEHRDFKLELAKICESILQGNTQVNLKLVEYLSNWYVNHICVSDQDYKHYMINSDK